MPFANYGTGTYSNSAGNLQRHRGHTTLSGQYVGISDSCGAISKAADGTGLIAARQLDRHRLHHPRLGRRGQHARARTQYYNVTRAKEVGRGWLPRTPG